MAEQDARDRVPEPPPVGVLLSDVTPEAVRWLWQRRIPLGKLTVLDGDPGLGKSTVTLDLAARVSVGGAMPDGTPGLGGGVVLLTAEDGLADTVRPRLEAAGANLRRILAVQTLQEGATERPIDLPADVPSIEEAVGRVGAVLVVIDPLMAFLSGNVDSHRDQDVRRALLPLVRLAERTNAALVIVRHLNKATGANALYRGGGSIGIVGAARAGLLVFRDPNDEGQRVLASTKSNLGPPPDSLSFRVVDVGGTAGITWGGVSPYSAASIADEPKSEEERSSIADAVDFLRSELADGPRRAKEMKKAAWDAGVSERTLMRAKKTLKVRSRRRGVGPCVEWVWEIPEAQLDTGGTFGTLGTLDSGATPNQRTNSNIEDRDKDANQGCQRSHLATLPTLSQGCQGEEAGSLDGDAVMDCVSGGPDGQGCQGCQAAGAAGETVRL